MSSPREACARALPAFGGTRVFGLSGPQRWHLRELLQAGCELHFEGFDSDPLPLPVIARRDSRGWKTYAIRVGGAGIEPTLPVLPMDDDEVESFDPADLRLLAGQP